MDTGREVTGPAPLRRVVPAVLAFATLYVVAAVLGRRTVLDDGSVSLVWPAAGVAALWFVARGAARPWADLLAVGGLTVLANVVTGGGPVAAVIFGAAAAFQAGVFSWFLARWAPRIMAGRGRVGVETVNELWGFTSAAVAGAVVAAPLALLAALVGSGAWDWAIALVWVVRNTTSVLVVGTLGLAIGARLPSAPRTDRPVRTGAVSLVAVAQYVAVLVVAPALYAAWFIALDHLPLAFPLIAITVWVGTQLRTSLVVLHATGLGFAAIWFTLAGVGPFAQIGDPTTQVVVAHVYVGLVTVIGLALAVARDERAALLEDVRTARDTAEDQATLLATIVDTMAEGVVVIAPDGGVVLQNPRAVELLGGVASPTGAVRTTASYGMHRLDGSPLPEEERPYRLALAGRRVRDLDLLIRSSGVGRERIVSFNSTRLPGHAGAGVVTMVRDVTSEREELHRAARVQESLLPTVHPVAPGYDLAARVVPVGSVGGDFYDWFGVPGGVVLTVADVMGKGLGAAILAATSRSVLRSPSDQVGAGERLSHAERRMEADLLAAGAFVTVFTARLELASGELEYSDAGHGLSLIVRADGTSQRLGANGPPLGLDVAADRVDGLARLDAGDTLVTFSDGILDGVGGVLEGLALVEGAVRSGATAAYAADAVLDLVLAAQDPTDDLTVVVVRRTGAGA
ncbi:SpoIIE family protein phosphatase [Actinotalea subterranea]|uniref:SpoIIE family protein phosphatase n=1 Tax=Actinotalea subterranea TaxID=2607497 RepID=UPI00165D994E|nr:SpoIIE family protein phosphatase [Actinotalea subterranea]